MLGDPVSEAGGKFAASAQLFRELGDLRLIKRGEIQTVTCEKITDLAGIEAFQDSRIDAEAVELLKHASAGLPGSCA